MLLIFLIALILLVDLGIKDTIEHTDDEVFPKKLEGTKGLVTIHKCHNPGLPFGYLSRYPELVKQLPMAVVSAAVGIFLWIIPRRGDHLQKLGLAFVLGGGMSNLYDRVVRGFVVDYVTVHLGKLKKVIFNLGDVCILLGAVLFFVGEVISCLREDN